MGKSVDSKVLQMRFDNKQFESGIKQSLNSLKNLKATLSNLVSSNKGLDVLGLAAKNSKSSIDQIASSVSALEKRFSFMGETVRKVANTIRDSLTSSVKSAVDYVKEGIVSGGLKRATNIENAHYQLQALLKDEKQVQKVMDNAMEAVDGTAYGFDEAAKAAAMFKASGIEAGEPMVNALKGISGTAAMTNADFERISLIFTSVAGQGRLMGDQLLQLSSLGLNAPATIAEYFNNIDDSSTKASDKVKAAVKEITNGTKVTEGDIRDMVSEGKVSFEIFAEAMYNAFGESAEKANETFNGAMSNMRSALARIGAEFVSPLIEQNSSVVKLINAVREKINDVKKALTFDKEVGNVEALSKRFTDFVLGMAKSLTGFVKSLDIASGMKVFYNVVDSVINVFKTLWSIVQPIGKAFAGVFLNFDVNSVISATGALKKFTEGLVLTEKQSSGLQRAFEGVFSVIKLVVDGIVGFVSAIFGIAPPINDTKDSFFDFIGVIGDLLKAFAEAVRNSKLVSAAFTVIRSAAKLVGGVLTEVVRAIKGFVEKAMEMKLVEKVIGAVGEAFQRFANFVSPAIEVAIGAIKQFIGIVKDIAVSVGKAVFNKVGDIFGAIGDAISGINVGNASSKLSGLMDAFTKTFSSIGDSTKTFLDNVNSFGERLKGFFDFSKVAENLMTFKGVVEEFAGWMKSTFGRLFDNFSLGGVGVFGVLYTVLEISKSFKKVINPLEAIPKVLGGVADALGAWGKQVKADALKTTAQSVLILAGALAILSFLDTEQLMMASVALSLSAGVFMDGIAKLKQASAKGKEVPDVLDKLADGLNLAMKNLTKAVKYKAIGSAFKDFAASIAIIVGSIAAVYFMYKADEKALIQASVAIGVITASLVAIVAGMNIMSKKIGNKNASSFYKMSASVLALTGALALIVGSIRSMMGLTIPSDYGTKMLIFSAAILAVSALAISMGKASSLAGKNQIKAAPLLALAVTVKATASAIASIFEIDVDNGYAKKLGILVGMFGGLSALIIAIGKANQLAGGALKGTGVLLALVADITAISLSLGFLSLFKGEKLLVSAAALGAVLLALAAMIKEVSAVANEDAAKSVLNMAIMVGTIAMSIGVLSMIPIENLLSAAVALGGALLALATNFAAISKITNKGAWQSIIAMTAAAGTVAISLFALAQNPWEQILAAGAAMSGALLSMAAAFKIMSSSNVDATSIAGFVAGAIATIPIAAALSMLAGQSWDSILPGAVSLNATMVVMAAALTLMSKGGVNAAGIAGFVAGAVSIIPIGVVLGMLSGQSWDSILPGAVSLNATMIVMAAALTLMSKGGVNVAGIAGFVAGAVALVPIGVALNMLAGQSWDSILPGAVALNATIGILTAAMAVLSAVGPMSLAGAVSFAAAAVALIPVAAAIKSLTGLSWQEVATGLVALAGGLVVIGAAGIAGTAVAPGLLALSAALLVFAAAIAAVGVALPVFVNGLNAAANGIIQFVGTIGGAVGEMVSAGANLIKGLAQGIASGVSSVIDGIRNVATNVIDTVKGVFGIHSPSTVMDGIGQNVDAGFAQGLSNGKGSIDSSIQNVFGGIGEKVKGMTDGVKGHGQAVGRSLADGINSASPEVRRAVEEVTNISGISTAGFMTMGIKTMGSFVQGVVSNQGNVKSAVQQTTDASGTDTSSYNAAGGKGASGFAEGLLGGSGGIQNVMSQISDATGMDLSSFTQMGNMGSTNFAEGIGSGSGSANDMMQQLADATGMDLSSFGDMGQKGADQFSSGVTQKTGQAKDATKKMADAKGVDTSSYTKLGQDAGNKFASGVKSATGKATSAGTALAKALKEALKSGTSGLSLKNEASKVIDSFASGIKGGAAKVQSSVQAIVKSMQTSTKAASSQMKSTGSQIIDSFASGIKSKSASVNNAVKAITKSITNALESAKKNFQKAGQESVSSYAKGISGKASAASKAAKEVSQSAIKALDGQASSFKSPGTKSATNFVNGLSSSLKSGMSKVVQQSATYGKQIVQGIANGLNSNAGIAKNAAAALARSIDAQVKSELQIHSPSKVAQERGEQFAAGLSLGLKNGIPEVSNAAKGLAGVIGGTIEKALFTPKQTTNITKTINKTLTKMMKTGFFIPKIASQSTKVVEAYVSSSLEGIAKSNPLSGNKFLTNQASEFGHLVGEDFANGVGGGMKKYVGRTLSESEKMIAESTSASTDKALKAQTKTFTERAKELVNTSKSARIPLGGMVNSLLGMSAATNDVNKTMKGITKTMKKDPMKAYSKYLNAVSKSSTEEAAMLETRYWNKILDAKKAGQDAEKFMDMDHNDYRKYVMEEQKRLYDEYTEAYENKRDEILGEFKGLDVKDENWGLTRQQIADKEYEAAVKEQEAEKRKKEANKNKKKNVKEEAETIKIEKKNTKSAGEIYKERSSQVREYRQGMKKLEKLYGGTHLWEEELKGLGIADMGTINEFLGYSKKGRQTVIKEYNNFYDEVEKETNRRTKQEAENYKKQLGILYNARVDGNGQLVDAQGKRIKDEDAYWQTLLTTKKQGADAEKYIDMDINEFRKQTLETASGLLEEYNNKVAETQESLLSSYNMFTTVEEKESLGMEKFTQNMLQNSQTFDDVVTFQNAALARLNDGPLKDLVQSLGPEYLQVFKDIASATPEEIAKMTEAALAQQESANRLAIAQNAGLKTEFEAQLNELLGTTGLTFEKFNEMFDGTQESLDKIVLAYGGKIATSGETVVGQVKGLMTNIVKGVKDGGEEGAKEGEAAGKQITEGVAKGVEDSKDQVKDAVSVLPEAVKEGAAEANTDLENAGKETGESYVKGVEQTNDKAKSSGETLANKEIEGADSKQGAFTNEGKKEATNYVNGVNSQQTNAYNAGSSLASQAASGADSQYNGFYSAGSNAGRGFVEGIRSMLYEARAAAEELARIAEKASRDKLKIKSPSKVMMQVGNFTGLGFVEGILSCVSKAARASEELGDAALNGPESYFNRLNGIVDGTDFGEPIIRPQVDLSNVKDAANDILVMFNNAVKTMSLDAVTIDTTFRQRAGETKQSELQKGKDEQKGGNRYEFVQNNYSPKPLSRSDIYRQTNNQFALFKQVTGGGV